jgi:hypothetical protein
MPDPTFETYKGMQRLTPAPTGDGGTALNGNVTFCADKIEAHDAHVASTANPHNVTAAQVGTYTSGTIDAALATKSNVGHTHSGADITTGTVADARLSSNVPLKSGANIFTAGQTIGATGSAATLALKRSSDALATITLDPNGTGNTGLISTTGTVTAGVFSVGTAGSFSSNNGLLFGNARGIAWSTTTDQAGTLDIGIARATNVTLKVTNGSTGFGHLRALSLSAVNSGGTIQASLDTAGSLTHKAQYASNVVTFGGTLNVGTQRVVYADASTANCSVVLPSTPADGLIVTVRRLDDASAGHTVIVSCAIESVEGGTYALAGSAFATFQYVLSLDAYYRIG